MKPQDKPLHIICEKDDIADIVLMSGDPLRAKYIAENYLDNKVLVSSLRNMYVYTGTYKGKRITVMGHGMGIPSMCIYAFELFYYFDVKKIIRMGTGGVIEPSLKLGDVVLANDAYSESSFSFQFDSKIKIIEEASSLLNEKVIKVAENNNINITRGTILTTDVFGPYSEIDKLLNRIPRDINPIVEEMEAYGLFYVANYFHRDATCLVTIVDSKYEEDVISPEDREKALDKMIVLGLESLILQ